MKFRDLHISRLLRINDRYLNLACERSQIILLSESVTDSFLDKSFEKTITTLSEDPLNIDLPFESVYVESISADDLRFILTGEKERRIVVAFFITKDLRSISNKYVCYNVCFSDGNYSFVETTISDSDLRLIKILNDKKNAFGVCSYNKKNRHTGDQLIKDIIFCDRVSRLKSDPFELDKKSFKYSHKFDVRGHWRKIKSVGKNPSGEYCVKGATWVSPFKKGSGDHIKKTRVYT